MKSKLEYIWLDGSEPTQGLRSKTQIRENFGGTLKSAPCGPSTAAQLRKLKATHQIAYLSQ